MSSSLHRINEYANAMFRREHLHDRWLERCADYLRTIFGSRLKGAVVLDYACGRGNWSVAFARAGVSRVYAVDASADNCRRLRGYLRRERIGCVEVVHGNVMHRPLELRADILWIYGIAHHIADRAEFFRRIRRLAADDCSQALVYHYNAGSMRELVVSAGRKLLTYADESAFVADSLCLHPAARLRARDDLTAPCVRFATTAELAALLRRGGLHPVRRVPTFQKFLSGRDSEEFHPHQLLCAMDGGREGSLTELPAPYAADISVLQSLTDAILRRRNTPHARRRIALGLFNTHFASLGRDGDIRGALEDVFLYLMYVLVSRGAKQSAVAEPVRCYVRLFEASLTGCPAAERRRLARGLDARTIARFLCGTTVRI